MKTLFFFLCLLLAAFTVQSAVYQNYYVTNRVPGEVRFYSNNVAISTFPTNLHIWAGANMSLRFTNRANGEVDVAITSTGGGSATNAISTISSNSVAVSSASTNLHFWAGSGVTLEFTNSPEGNIDVVIASTGVSSNNFPLTLTSDASAGDSAIVLNYIPVGIGTLYGHLVIDPYSTNCEIRRVASVSGNTVTLSSPILDKAHATGTEAFVFAGGDIPVTWFGARPNINTAAQASQNVIAFNRCSTNLYRLGVNCPGSMHLPFGTLWVNDECIIQDGIGLLGYGMDFSVIQANVTISGTNVNKAILHTYHGTVPTEYSAIGPAGRWHMHDFIVNGGGAIDVNGGTWAWTGFTNNGILVSPQQPDRMENVRVYGTLGTYAIAVVDCQDYKMDNIEVTQSQFGIRFRNARFIPVIRWNSEQVWDSDLIFEDTTTGLDNRCITFIGGHIEDFGRMKTNIYIWAGTLLSFKNFQVTNHDTNGACFYLRSVATNGFGSWGGPIVTLEHVDFTTSSTNFYAYVCEDRGFMRTTEQIGRKIVNLTLAPFLNTTGMLPAYEAVGGSGDQARMQAYGQDITGNLHANFESVLGSSSSYHFFASNLTARVASLTKDGSLFTVDALHGTATLTNLTGSGTNLGIDANGLLYKFVGSAGSTGSVDNAVILAPGSSTRNLMQPTADYTGLISKAFDASSTGIQYEAQLSDGTGYFGVKGNAGDPRGGIGPSGPGYSYTWNVAGTLNASTYLLNGSSFAAITSQWLYLHGSDEAAKVDRMYINLYNDLSPGNLVAGSLVADAGIGTRSTNQTLTCTATGLTNTLNMNYTVWLTAATGLSLTNSAGFTVFGNQTIAALTPITLQMGWKLVGTAITEVGHNSGD